MLELAILGLLTEESLHGYELKKQLSDMLGFASGVSFGSLYPALGRLETAGAVRVVEADGLRPAAAPTGSLGGDLAAHRLQGAAPRSRRGKKVYGITDTGRTLFEDLLIAESTANDDDRVFALRLAFARHLPPDARLSMLERRRARLIERVARLAVRVRSGRDRLDGYGRTLAEHDRDIAEHDLTWIDQLIATERAAAAAGQRPGPTPGLGDGSAPSPSTATPPRGPAAVPSISALRRPAEPSAGTHPASTHPPGHRPRSVQEDPTP